MKVLKPPKLRRGVGRPKASRRKDQTEKQLAPKRLMKPKWNCSKYNGVGHNISCTSEPIAKKAKGKPGRSKKAKQREKKINEASTSGIAIPQVK